MKKFFIIRVRVSYAFKGSETQEYDLDAECDETITIYNNIKGIQDSVKRQDFYKEMIADGQELDFIEFTTSNIQDIK